MTTRSDLDTSENPTLAEDSSNDLTPLEEYPVPDWLLQELTRRKTNLQSNPASGLSWDEVKRRIRQS